jgi:hypothetical protein
MVNFLINHLHTVKKDNYKIYKNHFNSGYQDPRNHASQLQIDEKHRQWDWQEGWVQKVSKFYTSNEYTVIF